jgi:hypothetical protein
MHFDDGHFIQLQDRVVMEVALLDAPVLERGFGLEGGGQPENDAALHLRSHVIGIDHLPAVHGADHPVDAHVAASVDRDLGHIADMGHAEGGVVGDAASLAGRQGSARPLEPVSARFKVSR